MLPATIDYILGLRDASGGSVASLDQYQIVVPNFPPLATISYSIAPADPTRSYILYEFSFGKAMVPHSFNIKIRYGSAYLLNAIFSGRFMEPITTFAVIGRQNPAINAAVTNLRLLTNYYEIITSFISITTDENYAIVMDALRRMHTSTKSEELLAEIARKPPRGGGR